MYPGIGVVISDLIDLTHSNSGLFGYTQERWQASARCDTESSVQSNQ